MYEVMEWPGKTNDLQILVDQISLETVLNGTVDLSSFPGWDEEKAPGIDVIDVQFNEKVKANDRADYIFAILSGAAAGVIDYSFVKTVDYIAFFKDIKKPENLNEIISILGVIYGFEKDKLDEFDRTFDGAFAKAEDAIHGMPGMKEMAKDFGAGMSIKSLVTHIICKVAGCRFGLDEEGKIVFERVKDEQFDGLSFEKKIQIAFCEWFFDQLEQYRKTKRFEDEVNGIFAFKNGIDTLKNLVKEVAGLALFKNGEIDSSKAYHWFREKIISETEEDDELRDLKTILVKQAVPVVINKALIRGYMFTRKFAFDLKDKNVKSIEGLEFINPAYMDDAAKKKRDLLEGMACGIFAAMDTASAALYGVTEGIAQKNVISGLYAFATAVNVVNICNIVAICRRNKEEITEAIKARVSDQEYNTIIESEEVKAAESETIVTEYLKLNSIETKILYSLELQIVKEDIENTKDSETQIRKNNWKKAWMAANEEATGLSKLYVEDSEKLYAMIHTRLGNEWYNGWLHRIALEIKLFKPYYQLDAKENPYKNLKYTNRNYMETVFCEKQQKVTPKDIEELTKLYRHYFDALEHKQEKTAVGAAGAVAATVTAGLAAYVFAPAIAVALAGHAFAYLHGAALTSACLALFGGGAIAAGGLGMAGGAVVIAGGGALLGMGVTGGMTATAMLLLASPSYVQRDQAKLLTTCEYVLIDMLQKPEEARMVCEQLTNDIGQTRTRLKVLKAAAAQNQKYRKESAALIKELEKSCTYMENAKVLLESKIKESKEK